MSAYRFACKRYNQNLITTMTNILSDKSIYTMCEKLASALCKHNIKLATAESCTGGWIAKACTDLPGSSAWFSASLVTYSIEAKATILGIDELLLQKYGAVSCEVVSQMLEKILLKVPDAGIAVAVSGIAGPDGGTADKPVGTVWIGWQLRDHTPHIRLCNFAGTRDHIRRETVAEAVQGILQLLDET